MTLDTWLGFAITWSIMAGLPGPNAFVSIAAANTHGLPRGLAVPIGISLAAILHILLVSIGLGSVLVASATAFILFKALGASYLIYLGIRQWRAPITVEESTQRLSGRFLLMQGACVSLSNPKVIMAYVAVFPQFIDTTAPLMTQLVVMGTTNVLLSFIIYSSYAVFAETIRLWFQTSRARSIRNRTTGLLLIFSGVLLLIAQRR